MADLEVEIKALLKEKNKLMALRLYVEKTNSSLIEAMEAIAAVEEGNPLPLPPGEAAIRHWAAVIQPDFWQNSTSGPKWIILEEGLNSAGWRLHLPDVWRGRIWHQEYSTREDAIDNAAFWGVEEEDWFPILELGDWPEGVDWPMTGWWPEIV